MLDGSTTTADPTQSRTAAGERQAFVFCKEKKRVLGRPINFLRFDDAVLVLTPFMPVAGVAGVTFTLSSSCWRRPLTFAARS